MLPGFPFFHKFGSKFEQLRRNPGHTLIGHVTLTDEDDIPDAIGKLRAVYPNLMKLDYDNLRTRSSADFSTAVATEQKTPPQLIAEFYQLQNGQALSAQQAAFADGLIRKIWDDAP